MSAKLRYREYCLNEKSLPIFALDWWHDAVCGEDSWDVMLVEKGGHICASMPYCLHKRFGLKIICQKPLSPYCGLHICYPCGQKIFTRLSYEKEVMSDIISQLDKLQPDLFCLHFHPQIVNWLPFYWAGFKQTTRYTYSIEDLSDPDKLWDELTKNTRNHIRKAQRIVTIRDDLGIDDFLQLNRQTFARQNIPLPYSDEAVKKLHSCCLKHDAGKILFAQDGKGQLHAGLFIIWDDKTVYSLMSGMDSRLRTSSAGNLLFWETIKFASRTGRSLDFLGSMLERVEHNNRSYAAALTPYFQISKASCKWKLAWPAREIYKSASMRYRRLVSCSPF